MLSLLFSPQKYSIHIFPHICMTMFLLFRFDTIAHPRFHQCFHLTSTFAFSFNHHHFSHARFPSSIHIPSTNLFFSRSRTSNQKSPSAIPASISRQIITKPLKATSSNSSCILVQMSKRLFSCTSTTRLPVFPYLCLFVCLSVCPHVHPTVSKLI